MRLQALLTCATLAALTGATSAADAQGKGKPGPSPVSVASTVHDDDGAVIFLLQSDGLGPYSTAAGVIDEVSPVNGDWELDLSAQSARTVYLTFSPVDGSSPIVSSGHYNARVISRCFDADGNITGFLLIGEGQANARCSLRAVLTSLRKQYVLVMSPLYAGTGWATVSCSEADGDSSCEDWTITPGAGANATIASLYEVGKGGRDIFRGFYFNTFRIDVTR